jgi:hypothetical protein
VYGEYGCATCQVECQLLTKNSLSLRSKLPQSHELDWIEGETFLHILPLALAFDQVQDGHVAALPTFRAEQGFPVTGLVWYGRNRLLAMRGSKDDRYATTVDITTLQMRVIESPYLAYLARGDHVTMAVVDGKLLMSVSVLCPRTLNGSRKFAMACQINETGDIVLPPMHLFDSAVVANDQKAAATCLNAIGTTGHELCERICASDTGFGLNISPDCSRGLIERVHGQKPCWQIAPRAETDAARRHRLLWMRLSIVIASLRANAGHSFQDSILQPDMIDVILAMAAPVRGMPVLTPVYATVLREGAAMTPALLRSAFVKKQVALPRQQDPRPPAGA